MNDADTLRVVLLLALVWSAAWVDCRVRRIPNWLTFGGTLAGLFMGFLLGGFAGVGFAGAGWLVGLGVLLPGFLLGGTGAGDVKLMAAAGTLLGPWAALLAGLASILCGAGLAMAAAVAASAARAGAAPWQRYGLMMRTAVLTGRVSYVPPAEGEFMGRKFPFAVAVALGVTIVVLWLAPGGLVLAGGAGGNV